MKTPMLSVQNLPTKVEFLKLIHDDCSRKQKDVHSYFEYTGMTDAQLNQHQHRCVACGETAVMNEQFPRLNYVKDEEGEEKVIPVRAKKLPGIVEVKKGIALPSGRMLPH